MDNQIKILLADDEVLFRKGISFLLQKEENMKIVFEASNGNEILNFLKFNEIHPDIILMDLKMPDLNGVEATKIIQKNYPNIKIIALTSYNTKCFIANMIQVGATSYIVKTATPNEVVETINEVDKKGYYYNDSVLEIINESKFLPFNPINENLDEDLLLTKREKEILRLICFQLNSTQIAEKLQVSSRTIDTHRYNLQIKINSKNIAGMVVYAIQNKIINLEELALESNDVIVDYSKFSNN